MTGYEYIQRYRPEGGWPSLADAPLGALVYADLANWLDIKGYRRGEQLTLYVKVRCPLWRRLWAWLCGKDGAVVVQRFQFHRRDGSTDWLWPKGLRDALCEKRP